MFPPASGLTQQNNSPFPGTALPAGSIDTPEELKKLAERKHEAMGRMAKAKREYEAAGMEFKALDIEIAKYGTCSQHNG
jgi:hypothetical protein